MFTTLTQVKALDLRSKKQLQFMKKEMGGEQGAD